MGHPAIDSGFFQDDILRYKFESSVRSFKNELKKLKRESFYKKNIT